MIGTWPCSVSGAEYAFTADQGRKHRILVLPALFDEANKLRHFTVEVIRRLDGAGFDATLPDLPGMNESLAPLSAQSLESWRAAASECAGYFRATHVLTLRAGAMLAPAGLAGWRYAANSGQNALRALLRARVIASREMGQTETREELLERGRAEGLELAGYQLGVAMIDQLASSELPASPLTEIAQGELGGGGLWLRAEPDHDVAQADRLAAIIAQGMTA